VLRDPELTPQDRLLATLVNVPDRLRIGADDLDGADDHHGDETGQEAILYGGSAGFVRDKTRDEYLHSFLPSGGTRRL
jgi:hypothetical protein